MSDMIDPSDHIHTFINSQTCDNATDAGDDGAALAQRVHTEIDRMPDALRQQIAEVNDVVHGGAPSLPLASARRRVVRMRAMVQDMGETEFFVSHRTSVRPADGHTMTHCGLYADSLELHPDYVITEAESDGATPSLAQRQQFTVISVPSLAHWAAIGARAKCAPADFESDTMQVDEKRAGDAQLEGEKRTRFPVPDSVPPLHERVSIAQLLVYHEADSIKLNELYDFVCVLAEPVDGDDKAAGALPPHAMPRLHVLSYTKLMHNVHLAPDLAVGASVHFEQQQKAAREMLTGILLGDTLAAEFLLYALISSVWKRVGDAPVGKFSINLRSLHMSGQVAKQLSQQLCELLPMVHCVPLTLSALNTENWTPRKDYTVDRLLSGRLQVPSGTVFVIDETQLCDGKLNEQGLKNLRALRTVVAEQRVNYDFQYHTSEFHTDVRAVVVSEGKSLISCDCDVLLETAPGGQSSPVAGGKPQDMLHLRQYLSAANRIAADALFAMDDGVEKQIEQDFVHMRAGDKRLTGDHLSMLITCARLVCAARGCNKMTIQDWSRAKVIDGLRAQRLK